MEKELIDFIRNYYKKHNKFPMIDTICERFNLKRFKVIEILRTLENKRLIRRSVANYSLPAKKIERKKVKQQIPLDIKKNKKIEIIKIVTLKFVILVVGVIATYLSMLYSFRWFCNFLNVFNSFLFSIAVVGFSVVAFEVIILCKQNDQYILVSVFSFLWIIVLVFSMLSTVAVQLSLEMQKEINQEVMNIENDNEILLYEEYEKRIEDIKIEIESKRKERQKLHEFIDKTEFDNDYKNLNYRIFLKNKDIENLKKELNTLQNKAESLLKKGIKIQVKRKITFYEWLEKVFKINRAISRFVLQLFPAIFIDLIAPISFAIVLFYKKI